MNKKEKIWFSTYATPYGMAWGGIPKGHSRDAEVRPVGHMSGERLSEGHPQAGATHHTGAPPADAICNPPCNQGGGDITENGNSCYGFLLRFITFYYGYYGTFLKDLLTLNQDTKKKKPRNPTFAKTLEKSSRFITDIAEYYGYYGNRCYGILRNITVRNISHALM